eukprot:776122-Pyramimonas_sp.AAC.1
MLHRDVTSSSHPVTNIITPCGWRHPSPLPTSCCTALLQGLPPVTKSHTKFRENLRVLCTYCAQLHWAA